MGVNVSKKLVTDEEKQRHQRAEKIIAKEQRKNENVFNLLLLGPGDSGKSTIIKQMRILHGNGFEEDEINHQRYLIIGNIIYAMAAIIRAMREFGIKFDTESREADAVFVLSLEKVWSETRCIYHHDWLRLKLLWDDGGVQRCFARANEFQLPTATKYFCDSMVRISQQDYTPTYQDMLYSRSSTVGIVEIEFTLRGLTLKVIDVGGQRSQRKKWIHCFENINALIYVAAISEYNQVLEEDASVNRILEAINLFSMIVNSRWFVKSSVVMFLNKKDIFEEKLKIFPLSTTFPYYKKGNDFDQAYSFIQNTFLEQNRDKEKSIYTHPTCATDTRNIEFVLDSSFDILLKNRLSRSGLV